MKKYKVIPTKKQKEIIKLYWKMCQAEVSYFWAKIGELERKMSKMSEIKDLEFFMCDNEFVGVGNYDRTMKLIQRKELDSSA